ncbi:hypothetical protein [Polaribacter sargassicola]|uniref:hypothetical protein n=1 Tax=Polaribacter sargassicola TaxID=2836891 RepID=UPI001F43D38E|nr:hypothetical protein [Polaribacter sp. DS7-9]MCG1036634.1 hypothetical protein [Polaribacter sp. DS7-9]
MKEIDFIPFKPKDERDINIREKDQYHKNLDVIQYDSYINIKDKSIHIIFPVAEKDKTEINGYYFYDLLIGKILVIHISIDDNEERKKPKKRIISLDIAASEIKNVIGEIDITLLEKLTIFIYNDNSKSFPEDSLCSTNTEKSMLRPKEGNGGGVIIEGP